MITSINTPNMSSQEIVDIKNLSNGIYSVILTTEYTQIQKLFIKQ